MNDAIDLLERVPAVLVFLTALTVVAECAESTGVFDAVGDTLVRWTRGRVITLWIAHLALCALVTAFLSLDTTAVLMTSAAVVLARRVERPVAMFAFPTLWIANMGSMWLPVSNLTNLLAHDVMTGGPIAFLRAAWPAATVSALVPVAAAALVWRRHLGGFAPHETTPTAEVSGALTSGDDHAAARRVIGTIILAMCGGILVVEPAVAASVAAGACLVTLWARDRAALREVTLPWRSLAITTGLFLAVACVHGSGVLRPLVERLAEAPTWQLTAGAGVLANATNNLPTYLALEPAATGHTGRLIALLLGVNVLSGITWWGSVATLLWRDRLARAGEDVSFRRHLALTGSVTILTAALAALTVGH